MELEGSIDNFMNENEHSAYISKWPASMFSPGSYSAGERMQGQAPVIFDHIFEGLSIEKRDFHDSKIVTFG